MTARITLLALLSACGGAAATTPAPADEVAEPAPTAPEYSITNLYDAFGRDVDGVTHDFGFSALVRYGELTILFDGGTDRAVFENNARAMGVDLRTVDIVILSHNHPDHIAGLSSVVAANPSVKVYLPQDGFLGGWMPFNYMADEEARSAVPEHERYRPHTSGRVGFEGSGPLPGADVEYVGESMEIAPGVRLVATRAELMGYYMAYPPHQDEPRHIPLPELSLSLRTPDGQVLVVGCSHSTVEAIVQQAREEDDRPIDVLMGGYHLLPYDAETIQSLAARLADEHAVQSVAPAHCTGPLAIRLLREAFGDGYTFAGLGERLVFADASAMAP